MYLSLLRDARIRTIWLGETVNAFGSGLTFWALAWLLYRTFPRVPLLTATVLAALSSATVLGTLGLGAYLDHWDRRRVLVAANGALAGLTALLPLVIGVGTPLLFALIAVIGLLRSLPAPALSATLPSLVPPPRLPGLQALFNLTWMTGELLAPTVAGLLITGLGAARVLWLDAGTFVLAALAYGLVRFPAQARAGEETGGLVAWWSRLRAGWGFVAARPALWGMFVGLGAVNAFFEM